MKPRALQTFKILAVAVAAVGCAKTASPVATAEPAGREAQPPAAMPVQAPLPVQTGTPGASELSERPIPPLPPGPAGVALYTLAQELDAAGPEQALQQVPHFRPICDKDGYPLVGNVQRKSAHPGHQPSAFCAGVRAKVVARR
jgi:hypothetical protein